MSAAAAECLHWLAYVCAIIDFCVDVCAVLSLCDLMFVPVVCVCVYMPRYSMSGSFCIGASACMCVNLCVRASTYWQGFKKMFLLRLSLICPAEYRELLKGYYTAEPRPSWRLSQHLKPPRAVTAPRVWSIFRYSCTKIIALPGEMVLTPDSWQWILALTEYNCFILTCFTS